MLDDLPGVPVCKLTSIVLVAHGMVTQSVAQLVPMMLPVAGLPPVMLNDMAKFWVVCWLPDHDKKSGW